MIKRFFIPNLFCTILNLLSILAYGQTNSLIQDLSIAENASSTQQVFNQNLPHFLFSKKNKRKKFIFNFFDKPLLELIQDIASLLEINIILPQGAFSIPANLKISIAQQNHLNLLDTWKELTALLELAGYTIIVDGNSVEIHKIDQNVTRQPMNLYIDPHPKDMIDSQEIIRCILYLTNLNIKASWNDLNGMLKDILSQTADIRADYKANALILTDKAANIKAALQILYALEEAGVPDTIEVLPLYYISAQLVDDLFNKQLLANKTNTGPSFPGNQDQTFYFPKQTKVVSLAGKNSLVIIGTAQTINLVKDFIIKYLDRPPESGKSILHIYDLQYLNATEFAPILQQIVNPMQTEQSSGKIISGPKQYFKDVIIQPELTRKSKEITPTVTTGTAAGSAQPITEGAQIGGNKLIIAAREKDWIRIKNIIQELDQPQKQVALEVLIVDISLSANKALGNQMRNKNGFNNSISENVDFQAAHITEPILKPGVESGISNDAGLGIVQRPADALAANLLQLGNPFGNNENLASTRDPGSLIISFNDSKNNGVWSVWQILNKYASGSILAQPFVVTKNHKQAVVSVAQQKFLQGSADTSNIAPKINREWVTAALTIDILPHISSTNNVNLQVIINVNEFLNETADNRITRLVQTNANVGNGQILALGGLSRVRDNISINKTPILGDLPIFGWFFKNKQVIKEKTNLLIFIAPTIITPKTIGGIDQYTEKKMNFAKNAIDIELNEQNLRDPITRWFFKPDVCLGERTIEDYTTQALSNRYESAQEESYEYVTQEQQVYAENHTKNGKDIDELKKLLADLHIPQEQKIDIEQKLVKDNAVKNSAATDNRIIT